MGDLYYIRHGFTPANNANYNKQREIYTIADDCDMPLEIIYGREQARELGTFLNTIKGKTLIYVSPYRRTRETLDIALDYMNGNYEIIVCDDLHEINVGVHYAKMKDEVLEEYPEAIEYYQQMKNNPFKATPIGGESFHDVIDRVKDISFDIYENAISNEYANVFIFGHGTVNRFIYYNITGVDNFPYQHNCEVIMGNGEDIGRSVFMPKTFVPRGYKIIFDDYNEKQFVKMYNNRRF